MIQNIATTQEFDTIAEAKRRGYNFFKVYLHPNAQPKGRGAVRMSGCVELKGYPTGRGANASFEFHENRDGQMVFRWDQMEREHIGWLYDDNTRGPYSPYGFNRDMIAAHTGQNVFVIKDPELYADIALRFKACKKIAPTLAATKAKEAKKLLGKSSAGTQKDNINDIEEQIKFLKKRKEVLVDFEDTKKAEKKKLDDAANKALKTSEKIENEANKKDEIKIGA